MTVGNYLVLRCLLEARWYSCLSPADLPRAGRAEERWLVAAGARMLRDLVEMALLVACYAAINYDLGTADLLYIEEVDAT